MPIQNDSDTGRGSTPADREALMRRWFATLRPPLNPDTAGVVEEAEAIEQESIAFADSVRRHFGEPGGGQPGFGPAPGQAPELQDLLIATQVVVGMCEALLQEYQVSAARQQVVAGIYDTVKSIPDTIRQAMAPPPGSDPATWSPTSDAPGTGATADAPDDDRARRRSERDRD